MAEAERIIGTPDTPDAAGAGRQRPGGNAGRGGPSGAEGAQDPAGRPGTDGTAAGVDGRATAAERPRGRRRIAVLFTVAVIAYALDLASKMLVVAKLEHRPPIQLIGDWLQLEAIRNAGAAFGFGEAFTVIFTVIAAAVIVVIARLARKLYSLPWAIALGLLLGGALGNLTDRLFRAPGVFEGAVVDFISPKHFAVFNLADSAIVCGGILIVLLSFRGLDPDGTVHKD
ncbi:signal peptidase II [Streptomyces sp. 6-11-2]|uniref:signal peptidase II n=1 Tax=Streptomyces sp. 6-11-2 TaxID=2585753 RepID=UPI0011436519|nr:signal peptidase II [Streptomyces sp. 6-11-2]GED87542.1 lipoprotein signal peptidase [Streptomyces sp. 6-11-2]